MQYQASLEALIHPERGAPLFGQSLPWNKDSICAELSRLAYIRFEAGDRARLTEALARGGFGEPVCFFHPGADAQGFAASRADGSAWLAYRGTEPDRLRSIVSDLRFLPEDWPGGGRVHRGFAAAERSLAADVDAWVAGLGEAPLVVTGHSLGAAMATLTAARFAQAELVTFGSPRVGNAQFRRGFEGRQVRRYVDCRDIVEDLPPPGLFVHLDGERYIDRLGNVRPTAPGTMARIADQLRANWDYRRCIGPGNAPARELADHAPINYVSATLGARQGP
ncbi:MAG TPA: lipase family protein [Allosphingosinicella sp.]